MTDGKHDPKGGNIGGSRPESSTDNVLEPKHHADNEDGQRADEINSDDPHKVEKLAKAGRPNFDPDAGSD